MALAGCSDHGDDPLAPGGGGIPATSFSADVQPIFSANCVVCHGQNGNGNLDLRAGNAYANLVGVDSFGYGGKRILAGDPDGSVLYRKVTAAVGVGSVMPPDGSLPAGSIETIRKWIVEDAPDN
jgi:hypothetical protein